jgi:1-acyl-sn-glycerol-3-phosphate acyltransferase
MTTLQEAVTQPVRTTLLPLEHRMAVEHEHVSSLRDADYIEQGMPKVEWMLRYFAPEVRHVDRVPTTGPVLIVGNHSGYLYMPDVWATGVAVSKRRAPDAPVFSLAYDLLFAVPGLGMFMRRGGALPAGTRAAEAALGSGAGVIVYPGGDWEACRPWTDRNRIDFHDRMGFVRLALRTGVPVVPVVAHGSHHSIVVLSRGTRAAHALGLDRMKVHVLPLLFGPPFGPTMVVPPLPMPAKVTIEFLEPMDWSSDWGSTDDHAVRARYDEVTGRLQAALDRLHEERPHPILSRFGLSSRA